MNQMKLLNDEFNSGRCLLMLVSFLSDEEMHIRKIIIVSMKNIV